MIDVTQTYVRISSHKLQIERGRYSGKQNRLCATCNVIEDEIHLFCDWVKYMSLRNNMYQYILNSNVIRFNSQKELFIQLMTSTDEAVLRSLGVFINACNIS